MIFGFRSPAADMDRVDIFGRHLRIVYQSALGKLCSLLVKVGYWMSCQFFGGLVWAVDLVVRVD